MRMAWSIALLAASGCAVRTARHDYYLGPVLHRHVTVCERGADVSQVLSIGPLGEVGRQSGLALGVVDRVAVVPHEPAGPACTPSGEPRWRFSPFYLHVAHRDEPRLVRRMLVGAQATAGSETTALSIGGVATTVIRPPDDAVVRLRFDARQPMHTHFSVWTVRPGTALPESEILEEVP